MKRRPPFIIFLIVALIAIFIYHHYFFAYEEGIQSGRLINVREQKSIFTFYTGTIKKSASSNFIFSISNKSLADSFFHCRGKKIVIHYSRYRHWLPWRDSSGYVADKILFVNDNN